MANQPFTLKHLTSGSPEGTLEGGTEGSDQDAKLPLVSSAGKSRTRALEMGMALDALVAMFQGLIEQNRRKLDLGFEDLIGLLEEWRNEVPKA